MKIKGLSIAFAAVLAAAFAASAKTFDWPIDSPAAGARQFTAYHGETVRFNLRLSGAMTNLAPVAIYYQTNGMGKAEWFGPVPGTVFHPTNDCGAAAYRLFIRCTDPDGVNYTANGSLRMLDSPGFEPSTVRLPVQTLDFSKIEVLNPPWGEGGGGVDAATVTNIVEAATASATNALDSSFSSRLSVLSRSSTNYTDAAIASATNGLPTRAEIEAGWWSEWTVVEEYSGEVVFMPRPTYAGEDMGWMCYGFDDGTGEYETCYVAGTKDTLELSWTYDSYHYTATRHRVAAPVPTKPEDIGAASPGTVSNIVTKAYVEDLGIKGGGSELEDEVRHCTWVQCVTNGVFYWIVKEEE